MLIIDSSVWIEVLRGRLSLDEIPAGIWATTEPVLLEVLAGARDVDKVRGRLDALPLRSVEPAIDYLHAAELFRATRHRGLTVRSLADCLIAAVALRGGDTVIHRDQDFEALRQVCDLQTVDLR